MTDAQNVAPAIDGTHATEAQARARVTELAARHAGFATADWYPPAVRAVRRRPPWLTWRFLWPGRFAGLSRGQPGTSPEPVSGSSSRKPTFIPTW